MNCIMMLLQRSKETKHGHSQAFCSLRCHWFVLETMSPRNQDVWIVAFHSYLRKIFKCSQHAYGILSPLPPPMTSRKNVQANKPIDWKLNFETNKQKKVANHSHASFEPNRIQTKEYMWSSSRKKPNRSSQCSAHPGPQAEGVPEKSPLL